MANQEEKCKNTAKNEGLAALCRLGPRIRFRFDNGREFFAKNSDSAVFSWHTKGDFTLPVIPCAVGIATAAITLSCLFSGKKQ